MSARFGWKTALQAFCLGLLLLAPGWCAEQEMALYANGVRVSAPCFVRDGIAYFTGLSSWYQEHNYPDQQESEPDRFAEPGFSVVTVAREQIYVRRHRFIVDSGSLTS